MKINHNAMLIQNTLLEFDLETTVIDVQVGPTVTRYALQPHKEDGSDRVRMSRIAAYARDLSLALAAKTTANGDARSRRQLYGHRSAQQRTGLLSRSAT